MSPKAGQKITETPKDFTVRARIDKETAKKLDFLVKHENLDRSKIIRKGIELQYESVKNK